MNDASSLDPRDDPQSPLYMDPALWVELCPIPHRGKTLRQWVSRDYLLRKHAHRC